MAHTTKHLKLEYLDGLRGFAALYVVLHHAFMHVAEVKGELPPEWIGATNWARNGRIAVQVFIALSGYCLMLPISRSGHLRGGWLAFIKRRARRILPPYYAALILSLAVIRLVPGMNVTSGLYWDMALPATTSKVLVSHLVLLQDLSEHWILKINPVMWSLAQEWQIYFVFVFILLPVWRWIGIEAVILFTLAVSLMVRHLPGHNFSVAAPEFLYLFAAGMCAANINFPGDAPRLVFLRDRLPWGGLATVLWVAYFGCTIAHPDFEHVGSWRYAVLVGAATCSLLVSCTNAAQNSGAYHPLLRLCERPSMVKLGSFSYSLYLTHFLVLSLFALSMRHLQIHGAPALAVEILVAVPTAVATSFLFHRLAERPFMLGRPQTTLRAEKAAILDTAP